MEKANKSLSQKVDETIKYLKDEAKTTEKHFRALYTFSTKMFPLGIVLAPLYDLGVTIAIRTKSEGKRINGLKEIYQIK